jgi:hypothetical protein
MANFTCDSPAFPYLPLRQFFAAAAAGGAVVPTAVLEMLRLRVKHPAPATTLDEMINIDPEQQQPVSISELNAMLRSVDSEGCQYFPDVIIYPCPKVLYTTASGRTMEITSRSGCKDACMYMSLADCEITDDLQQGRYEVPVELSFAAIQQKNQRLSEECGGAELIKTQMPERWQMRCDAALTEIDLNSLPVRAATLSNRTLY